MLYVTENAPPTIQGLERKPYAHHDMCYKNVLFKILTKVAVESKKVITKYCKATVNNSEVVYVHFTQLARGLELDFAD